MMTIEIKDDVPGLAAWINSANANIIFLDGECGSGKSWLASELTKFGFATIDADQFVTRNTGRYVSTLNVTAFNAKISEVQSKPIVISCICARDVADALQFDNTKFIYVVRVTETGLDADRFGPAIERDPNTKIDPVLVPSEGTVSKEVSDYRARMKPQLCADLVFRNSIPKNLQ